MIRQLTTRTTTRNVLVRRALALRVLYALEYAYFSMVILTYVHVMTHTITAHAPPPLPFGPVVVLTSLSVPIVEWW